MREEVKKLKILLEDLKANKTGVTVSNEKFEEIKAIVLELERLTNPPVYKAIS